MTYFFCWLLSRNENNKTAKKRRLGRIQEEPKRDTVPEQTESEGLNTNWANEGTRRRWRDRAALTRLTGDRWRKLNTKNLLKPDHRQTSACGSGAPARATPRTWGSVHECKHRFIHSEECAAWEHLSESCSMNPTDWIPWLFPKLPLTYFVSFIMYQFKRLLAISGTRQYILHGSFQLVYE